METYTRLSDESLVTFCFTNFLHPKVLMKEMLFLPADDIQEILLEGRLHLKKIAERNP